MTTTQETIAALRKLQHLVLIAGEERKLGDGKRLQDLEADITKRVAALPPQARALYQGLITQSPVFLSPLDKGNCSACGAKPTATTLQHVIAGDSLRTCAGCGRLLYLPEVKATGLRPGTFDTKNPLSRFSSPKLVCPNLKATTPEEAIGELCTVLEKEHVLVETEAVYAAALEREGILTTAVGNGLAFPHMRGVEEGPLTFAAGISRAGIDWSGKKVHLVFFTVFPIVASPFYLKLIAAIARTFETGDALPFVLGAEDAKTLWKEMNKALRPETEALAAMR